METVLAKDGGNMVLLVVSITYVPVLASPADRR